jgi:3-deoxy-D-manno-octulosonic-acid transferase
MTRWLYSLLMCLAQPFLRFKLQRRARAEPLYAAHVNERFGQYTQPAQRDSELIWVHAVSLGETRTAAILIAALRHMTLTFGKKTQFLLTHGTATGRAEGVKLLQDGDVQVWQAWDTPAACNAFFKHFKPRVGLVMETEVWPNLCAAAQRHACPLLLVNARLSEKSLRGALRAAWLLLPAYQSFAQVLAQAPDDALRLRTLGAKAVDVLGNIKFDAQPNAQQCARGAQWKNTVKNTALNQNASIALFASSREGEEIEFLKEIKANLSVISSYDATNNEVITKPPVVQYLLVPRHPQRFNEVAALCEAAGFKVSRRSTWGDAPPAIEADAQTPTIWLGDSLGEMALYYAMADVALLGGSFAPLGGQNLIEAAACGCPVIMGPHTFNFAMAAELAKQAGAALRVAGMRQAIRAVQSASTLSAQTSLQFAAAHQGATAKTVNIVQRLLLKV